MSDTKAIDAVVNIWTPEALSHRPGWTDEFFVDKMKGQHGAGGISLEKMLEDMDAGEYRNGISYCRTKRGAWACRAVTICLWASVADAGCQIPETL